MSDAPESRQAQGEERREFLRRVGKASLLAGGAVWVAPAVLSVDVARAAAGSLPPNAQGHHPNDNSHGHHPNDNSHGQNPRGNSHGGGNTTTSSTVAHATTKNASTAPTNSPRPKH